MKAPLFSAYAKTPAQVARTIHKLKPRCERCYGDGQVMVHWHTHSGHEASSWDTCPECKGTKKATH